MKQYGYSVCLIGSLLLSGCGSTIADLSSSRKSSNVSTTETDGIITAKISSSSTGDQQIVGSKTSGVQDASISFPPGSLTTDTVVSMGTAEDKSTAIMAESGAAGTIVTKSTALYVGPQAGITSVPAQQLTLELPLPLSNSNLALATTGKLVFFYAIFTSDGWKSGVKPLTAADLVGVFYRTKVKGFGYFQIAYLTDTATEKEVTTAVRPAVKAASTTSTTTGIAELQGTWLQSCVIDGATSSQFQHTFSGANVTSVYTSYSDTKCSSKLATVTYSGTMAAAGDATTPAGAKKYNYTFATYNWTLKTAAYVTTFNTAKMCGISDWVIDTERSVLGKTCSGKLIDVGSVSYDIYKVSGSTLALGKEDATNTGKTDATRIAALDTNVLTKQ